MSRAPRTAPSRLVAAVNGGAWTSAARLQIEVLPETVRRPLERTNFAGRTVSLAGGIAAATGALAGVASAGGRPGLAACLAVAPAGALGALDDLTEQPEDRSTKGLKGHLTALSQGKVTTGFLKLSGIGLAGLAAGTVLAAGRGSTSTWRGIADAVASGALVAGTANLVNLLDLRPGRALKVVGAAALPLAAIPGPGAGVAAGVCGAVAAAAPSDLAESTMLGDTGANALGAALGVALAASPHPAVRWGALGVVVAGTLASERVSFSAVIERTPWLRALDQAGRRSQSAQLPS